MVRGFSNVGDVTLVLNGRPYGTLTPDAVNTVTWRDVPLVPGVNTIELRAGGMASLLHSFSFVVRAVSIGKP